MAEIAHDDLIRELSTLRARVAELEAEARVGQADDRASLDLILAVLAAVQEQRHREGALNAILREVGRRMGWVLGEAWVPNERGALIAAQVRCMRDEDRARLARFAEASEHVEFAPGDGLPGRVWSSGRHEWIRDLDELDPSRYRRIELAREAGLHAALAVPVSANDERMAVLVFYMDEPRSEERRRVELVAAAAGQLGLVLRQKQAHATIARLGDELVERTTPVLEIWSGIALAPVIGELDPHRVDHLIERVLTFLERRRSKVVLVDVTAVPEIETIVASKLVDLSRATKMLGARMVLTGVRPALARALVHLGVSFGDLRTEGNLADGLGAAMELAG